MSAPPKKIPNALPAEWHKIHAVEGFIRLILEMRINVSFLFKSVEVKHPG